MTRRRTIDDERCPNCRQALFVETNNGETACEACGLVVATTYEPAYDPGRTRDLGGPGGAALNRNELRGFGMPARLAGMQNRRPRTPTGVLTREYVENSPFLPWIRDLALRLMLCVPDTFYSNTRRDTAKGSFGLPANPTADEKTARTEARAELMAWSLFFLIDEVQPLGWDSLAEECGIETRKCKSLAFGLKNQIGYLEGGRWRRIRVTDALGLPRPTYEKLMEAEIERRLVWLGNRTRLVGMEKASIHTDVWRVIRSWGIPNRPIDEKLSRRSRANIAEMTISMIMKDRGYSNDLIEALQRAFPSGRMKQTRAEILGGTFSPWPAYNDTSLHDDFSSNGGNK